MKAIVLHEFNGELQIETVQDPKPQDSEVLIKASHAGVNPVDWKIREGYLKDLFPHNFPIILGWDVSGVVVEAGKDVHNLHIGEEVFAYVRKPIVKWGAYCEYVTFEAKDVVRKPKNISLSSAAALPLVSLTAWQSLFDTVGLKKGEKILIQGGSGGVGSMAVQFAKYAGSFVIATACPKKHAYVKQLGADRVIDYKENLEAALTEKVDVVFDCVGGEAFEKSLPCLKKGGRIVSILEHMDQKREHDLGIKAYYVFVHPSGQALARIAELIEHKKIVPPHIEEMALEEAFFALEKQKSGNVFGKLVLKV